MEPIIIATCFLFGISAKSLNLPPMLGFLLSGFVLKAFGFESSNTVSFLADLGVTLLLFTIGLKLQISNLFKPVIFAGSALNVVVSVLLFNLAFFIFALFNIQAFVSLEIEQSFLIAFSLSFSSTVFAVKSLEDKSELQSLFGKIAIGILIMQDIFAVVFLTITSGVLPSTSAFLLLGLFLIKPFIFKILDFSDYGEMLVLFGLFAALMLGQFLFESVGLKADLGALLIGMFLASHKKAPDLAESLFNFKELFLIAFFLQIGLEAELTKDAFISALVLTLLLPLKHLLYFVTIIRFGYQARTAFMSSLALSNFSEFGLIVASISVTLGILNPEWLVTLALSLSFSFLILAPLNNKTTSIYSYFSKKLKKFENSVVCKDDRAIPIKPVEYIVIGLGSIGIGIYDELEKQNPSKVLGIENDPKLVKKHQKLGRYVILANASDSDFWENISKNWVNMIFLAMPHHKGNEMAAEQLYAHSYKGKVAALIRYKEEEEKLRKKGVDFVYNLYSEAGISFTKHAIDSALLEK